MTRKEKIHRIAVSILIAGLLFSAGSFIPAIPVFIFVPAFVAFIITFILEEKKFSALASIIITSICSIIFSLPPGKSPGATPGATVLGQIAERQSEMLRFSPPLLLGILGGVLGWGAATLLKNHKKPILYATWVIFILICINFAAISVDLNPTAVRMASREPVVGKYNNFNSLNLKTFYLMKRGFGFYDAYSSAFSSKHDTFGQDPGSIWNWRMPTVFYLWNLMLPTDGFYIFYLYLILSVLFLYFSFDIAGDYLKKPLNLIAPALIVPVFVFGAAGFWFTFPEYWGAFFFMLGIWGIFKKNKIAALIGFTFAPLIRSFFIISYVGAIIPSFLKKEKKQVIYLLIPGVIFVFAFLFHYIHIMSLPGAMVPPAGDWIRGGLKHFQITFSFSSVLWSRAKYILPLILVLFFPAFYVLRKDYAGRILLGSAILPMIMFLIVGPSTFRQYWGIVYLPFIMLAISLAFSFFKYTGVQPPHPHQQEEKG